MERAELGDEVAVAAGGVGLALEGPQLAADLAEEVAERVRLPSVAERRRSAFSLRLRYFRIPAASSMMRRRSSGRALSTASIWPWLTITCCCRPTPVSDRSSWMSSSRQGTPLMAYSLSPVRNSVRVIVTSVNSIGRIPPSCRS